MSLTKREKILLYVLALVIVIAGGGFKIVMPLYKQAEEAKRNLQDSIAQKQELQYKLSSLEGAAERLADEQQRQQEERYFYHDLQDVLIDRTIYKIAQQNDASISKIVIADPESSVLEPFEPYESGKEQDTSAHRDENGENAAQGPTAMLYQCEVSISGTQDACVGVVDALNDMGKSVYVSDFNMILGSEPTLCDAVFTVRFYFLEE